MAKEHSNVITVKLKSEQRFSVEGTGFDELVLPEGELGVVCDARVGIRDDELAFTCSVYFPAHNHAAYVPPVFLEVVDYPYQDAEDEIVKRHLMRLASLLVHARNLPNMPDILPPPPDLAEALVFFEALANAKGEASS